MDDLKLNRGDIYYISNEQATGSEYSGGRPAVIVSNDVGNRFSPTVEVVYLTTKKRNNLKTHVPVRTAKRPSTALCESIYTVDKTRIREKFGRVNMREMADIEKCILIGLGVSIERNEKV